MKCVFSVLVLVCVFHLQAQVSFKTNFGHSDNIACFDINPTNTQLVSGGRDGKVIGWDIKTGKELFSYSSSEKKPLAINSIDISNDGTWAASTSSNHIISIWNLKSFKKEKDLKIELKNNEKIKIQKIVFDPISPQVFYTIDDSRTFRKWDVNTGVTKLLTFGGFGGFKIVDFSISKVNNLLALSCQDASGNKNGVINLYNYSNFEFIRKIYNSEAKLYMVDFHPTELKLVLGLFETFTKNYENNRVVYDAIVEIDLRGNEIQKYSQVNFSNRNEEEFPKFIKSRFNDTQVIKSIGYSPNGQQVVSASTDGYTVVWDRNSTKSIVHYQDDVQMPEIAKISPDNQFFLSVVKGRTIGMWSIESKNKAPFVYSGKGLFVNSVAYAPQSKKLLIGGAGVFGLDLSKLSLDYHINYHNDINANGYIKLISDINMSKNSSYFVSSSGGNSNRTKDDSVFYCDINTGKKLRSQFMNYGGVAKTIFNKNESILFGFEGIDLLSFGKDDASKHVFSVSNLFTSNTESFPIRGKSNFSTDIAYANNADLFAYTDESRKIVIINSSGTFSKTIDLDVDSLKKFTIEKLALTADGSKIIVGMDNGMIRIIDIASTKHKSILKGHTSYITSLLLSDNGQYLLTGSGDKTIRYWNLATNKQEKVFANHQNTITDLTWLEINQKFASSSNDGTVKIWNTTSTSEIVTIVTQSYSDQFLVYTPDFYYYGTKLAIDEMAHFLVKDKINAISQFDLIYNRPDIILQSLGIAPATTIATYKKAWEKRIKKMGFSQQQLALKTNFNMIPSLTISGFDANLLETNLKTFEFKITAKESVSNLQKLMVNINGIPLYGVLGKSISKENCKSFELPISLELATGNNQIEVSVLNDMGLESITESFQIRYTPSQNTKPNLYVFAIGVSEFINTDMNLTFAAKDANDIANTFKKASNSYQNIYTKTLINSEATAQQILQLKSTLLETKPEDQVIMFLASHGLLDANLDYYLATYDIDFNNPQSKGLKYEDFEKLMDEIPARQKLVMIDACHSGEVDKDEKTGASTEATTSSFANGIKSRGFKVGNSSSNQSLDASFDLMKSLFADLRRNNGTVVISAAAGKEFALESDHWNNGVFTYAILNGLKSQKADLDRNNEITVKELSKYISEEVKLLTQGKQNPTSRTENIQFDFKIW